MSEDILRKFVNENREDFDDQTPDSDILGKIQSRLGLEPSFAKPKRVKIIRLGHWWAAAALIIITIGISVFFQKEKHIEYPVANKTNLKVIAPAVIRADKTDSGKSFSPTAADIANPGTKITVAKRQKRRGVEPQNITADASAQTKTVLSAIILNDWQKSLQNESSSVRLAAILASGKGAALSPGDLQTLVNTMNNDPNTNVRLAAFDILKKQEYRGQVKDQILQSVNKQDDPFVQMELLASLSPDEVAKVEQQLLDITQNPMSMEAVRNQAYAVLLHSNTNF